MSNRTKGKRKKPRITMGTKQNLNTIIDELSFIIGRKNWPEDEPTKTITNAFNNLDAYIAAISLILPDIDNDWRLSSSRDSFCKIKHRRQFRIRLLISLAVLISLGVIGSTIVAVIFINNWIKWIILIIASVLLLLSSTNFSKFFMKPIISKFDKTIPQKFANECRIIDNYVKELILLRRKL